MPGAIVSSILETAENYAIAGLRVYRMANKAIGLAVDSFVKDFQDARPKEKKARD